MGDDSYFAEGAELADEHARLSLIEADSDPATIRFLTRTGVGEGWSCLEVGAGGGSITRWLSERVGPSGRVVAADIDTRHVTALDLGNVEVRQLDITKDDVEVGVFDLAHCRYLLMHLSDPASVLEKMVKALRPGGWLLVEDVDNSSVGAVDDTHPLAASFTNGCRRRFEFSTAAGISDCWIGAALPSLMQSVGLIEVGNEGVSHIYRGGEPMSLMWIKTWGRLNDRLVDEGVVTEEDINTLRQAYEDPTFAFRGPITEAVWGRRP
jgi:SAM-dependent methyltransferase